MYFCIGDLCELLRRGLELRFLCVAKAAHLIFFKNEIFMVWYFLLSILMGFSAYFAIKAFYARFSRDNLFEWIKHLGLFDSDSKKQKKRTRA
jgi:hypothetical protein